MVFEKDIKTRDLKKMLKESYYQFLIFFRDGKKDGDTVSIYFPQGQNSKLFLKLVDEAIGMLAAIRDEINDAIDESGDSKHVQ